MTGLLAYRFALDPTPAQERALRSHAGAARVAFNWGLARVKAVMDQRAAEATYGITGGDLTPAISWSLYSLRKDWNAAKDTAAPWWAADWVGAPRRIRTFDLPLRRSSYGHSSSASLLARARMLGLWLQLDVPGFRLVRARGGHGHTPVDCLHGLWLQLSVSRFRSVLARGWHGNL